MNGRKRAATVGNRSHMFWRQQGRGGVVFYFIIIGDEVVDQWGIPNDFMTKAVIQEEA